MESELELKVGQKCTVAHHYGHTDTEKVMTITNIEENLIYNSGIAVKVDGLKVAVDKNLIIPVEKSADLQIYSLLSVCLQAESMRNSQRLYFVQIAKAKRTKIPGDYAAAKMTLELSKQLEKSCDDSLAFIRAQEALNSEGLEVEP